MKPYFAVIADSFREALASRVLWLTVLCIIIFLIVLSPIGLHEEVTTKFRRFDISSTQRLVNLLGKKGLQSTKDTASKRIAGALDEAMQKRIREQSSPEPKRIRSHEIVESLNKLLDDESWYDAETWKSTTRLRELRELDDTPIESLSDEKRKRRARLRIEAALPGSFQPRSGDSVRLQYAGIDFPDSFVITKPQFTEIVNKIAMPLIVGLLLGVLGVFIAILVTASIIPEMFQSGSLQLLLSKPVSRALLFLAKFIGGCSFIVLNIVIMVVGLWLIAGLRLGLWNHNLLYCIPLFVFLFMVYYSVSAVSGLIWRNAIVSIAVTVIFWIGCFLVRLTDNLFDQFVAGPATITQVAKIGDDHFFAATRSGEVAHLEGDNSHWDPILESSFRDQMRVVGPILLSDSNQIVSAQIRRGRFNSFSDSNVTLQILNSEENWKPIDGINLPPGTRDIFPAQNDGLLAIGINGIRRLEAKNLEATAESKQPGLWGNLMSMIAPKPSEFVDVNPPGFSVNTPMSACVVEGSSSCIIYSRGELTHLEYAQSGEKYAIKNTLELEGESNQRAAIAAGDAHVALAREDSGIEIYSLEPLKLVHSIDFESLGSPTHLAANPGGSEVAVLFSDQTVRLIDCSTGEAISTQIRGQGTISHVYWPKADELLVAYEVDRIQTINIADGSVLANHQPSRDAWRLVQDWIINPLHAVFPKPGELGDTADAFVIGDTEVEAGPSSEVDLDFQRRLLKIWEPIISCGIFTVVMLMLGCLYISRQDF